ncbi:hypothetical protein TNCV_2905871 [Trichonephila clavipes]|nr:hypothetical protein TNCV_2905871 [Trichonephila clavipes]
MTECGRHQPRRTNTRDDRHIVRLGMMDHCVTSGTISPLNLLHNYRCPHVPFDVVCSIVEYLKDVNIAAITFLSKPQAFARGFFAMLPVLGKKAVLEWRMKEGLIGSSYVCLKCGKSMELRERTGKKVNDGF